MRMCSTQIVAQIMRMVGNCDYWYGNRFAVCSCMEGVNTIVTVH